MNNDELVKKAYAKINLSLDVTGRREDGYHEVRMVMQMVDLADTLTFRKTEEPGIVLGCDDPDVPCDSKNLVWQAAEMLMKEAGVTEGVHIYLEKRIPHAAGLGGGSSDAATTLHAVNELFGLGFSDEELCERGVRIGADVPYCVMGATALAEGIGEKLTVLPAMPDCFVVLARPDIDVPTGQVYKDLDSLAAYPHPDVDGQVKAIRDGSLFGVTEALGNVLEIVTAAKHPEITQIERQLLDGGAIGSIMSGSGATVFGIFADRVTAENAAREMKKGQLAADVFVTQPV
ncbi:MAG: 4-(cytidine 5'-diphospho)-2-C-methyl-D-erythritol kinase [Bilifractor sp.]|jgi:4-diphosphocytidyl-2-C-methyl-D-erythritol kinase